MSHHFWAWKQAANWDFQRNISKIYEQFGNMTPQKVMTHFAVDQKIDKHGDGTKSIKIQPFMAISVSVSMH